MVDALLTRASLLARLGDPQDRAAWQQFVELYGRLVYGFVRQRGLQDADAADLTQEVLLAVSQALPRWQYDRERGKFRGWLLGVTRHKLARFFKRRDSQAIGSGDTQMRLRLEEEPDPELEAEWEKEYQQQVFGLAAERVREQVAPKTWQAFWQTAVEGKSAAAVAAGLGMSLGALYVARSRTLARLSEQVRALEAEVTG
jgi:RNA polymerase sigma factor (sigma-70 family)